MAVSDWTQDYATQLGRNMGLLGANEIASGGLLTQRAAAAGKTGMVEDAWKQRTGYSAPAVNSAGVKPLTTASMNDYQKQSLYKMGQPSAPVNPNIAANYEKAGQAADRAGKAFDAGSYQQFMNPYLQEVVSRTQDNIRTSYDTARRGAREELAAGGGFGSTALGQYYSDINKDQERNIGDTTANLNYQGFNDAMAKALNLYTTGINTDLARSGIYSNLAGGYQNYDNYGRGVAVDDLNRQLFAGDRIQGQNQAELDAYNTERQASNNFPLQAISVLQSILGSYPGGTTTTQSVSGNPILSGLGGALVGSRVGGAVSGGASPYAANPYLTAKDYSGGGNFPWTPSQYRY